MPVLFFWLSVFALQAQTTSHPIKAPLRNDFQGILEFLSSDFMEGREAGTRGGSMAAAYIASMMQLNGLMPYGDVEQELKPGSLLKKSYFQNFTMIRCHVEKSSLALIRNSAEGESALLFVPGSNYKIDAVPFGREGVASVIYTGYGIEAPGKGYNDYAGLDVRNRVVVILDGYPGHSDTTSFARKKLGSSFEEDFGSLKMKLKTAERHGAAAVVFIDPKVLKSSGNLPLTEDEDEDNPSHYLPGDTAKTEIPCFRLGTDATIKLLEGSGIDLAGFEKKAANDLSPSSGLIREKKLRFSVAIRSEVVIIQNVLGIIPGIDTTRNVIVGGHFDHLGIRKGAVYNGADDNASGVAGMLALSKVWANHHQKPACNIIFAAWTGEEKGKLGSTNFARNSPVVPARVSLVINMDMISRSAPEDSAGRQLSIGTMTINEDLRNMAKKSNSKLKQPLILDLWDVTGHSGSDYAPFKARKVPIVTFHAGFPDEYHTPLDDASRADPGKMEKILKIVNDFILLGTENPPTR